MRAYCNFKALCGLSYICFTGTQVLGQFKEIRPEYLPNHVQEHMESNPNSSAFYFTSNETLL